MGSIMITTCNLATRVQVQVQVRVQVESKSSPSRVESEWGPLLNTNDMYEYYILAMQSIVYIFIIELFLFCFDQ